MSSGRRKGQAGDWMNYFTPRDRAMFAAAAQPALERFGYEPDAGPGPPSGGPGRRHLLSSPAPISSR